MRSRQVGRNQRKGARIAVPARAYRHACQDRRSHDSHQHFEPHLCRRRIKYAQPCAFPGASTSASLNTSATTPRVAMRNQVELREVRKSGLRGIGSTAESPLNVGKNSAIRF